MKKAKKYIHNVVHRKHEKTLSLTHTHSQTATHPNQLKLTTASFYCFSPSCSSKALGGAIFSRRAFSSSLALFSALAFLIRSTSALISTGSLGIWFRRAGSGWKLGMLSFSCVSTPTQIMVPMGNETQNANWIDWLVTGGFGGLKGRNRNEKLRWAVCSFEGETSSGSPTRALAGLETYSEDLKVSTLDLNVLGPVE